MMDAIKGAIQIEKSPAMPLPQKEAVAPYDEDEQLHALECMIMNDDELLDKALDEALELTFPASDPIAIHEHSKFTRPAVSRYKH